MTSKQAAREIRQLSSGTVGKLIGKTTYEEIDKAREESAAYVEEHADGSDALRPDSFDSWMDAWEWATSRSHI